MLVPETMLPLQETAGGAICSPTIPVPFTLAQVNVLFPAAEEVPPVVAEELVPTFALEDELAGVPPPLQLGLPPVVVILPAQP
jgi:hypothetical protein